MKTPKIEKNIPVEGNGNYNWISEMQVNDSVLIEKSDSPKVRSAFANLKRGGLIKYTSKTQKNGCVRFWITYVKPKGE